MPREVLEDNAGETFTLATRGTLEDGLHCLEAGGIRLCCPNQFAVNRYCSKAVNFPHKYRSNWHLVEPCPLLYGNQYDEQGSREPIRACQESTFLPGSMKYGVSRFIMNDDPEPARHFQCALGAIPPRLAAT
jgi:hypothetical protein